MSIHYLYHDDVIKWKHFPRYWPLVRGMHRSPVNSTHKGQWHGALMFSLIWVWIHDWVNNREAGDLRRHCNARHASDAWLNLSVICINLSTDVGSAANWFSLTSFPPDRWKPWIVLSFRINWANGSTYGTYKSALEEHLLRIPRDALKVSMKKTTDNYLTVTSSYNIWIHCMNCGSKPWACKTC